MLLALSKKKSKLNANAATAYRQNLGGYLLASKNLFIAVRYMQWKGGLTKEHTPPPPHLKADDDRRGEIELACRGNDSLGYDVTAHNSAKDVHQDGVHLNRHFF
jgi:hypothetical protein